LKIGGHNGEVVTSRTLKAGRNCRKRSEVATEEQQLARARELYLSQNLVTSIWAPVNYEHYFQSVPELLIQTN
jgi:hypothetical protein